MDSDRDGYRTLRDRQVAIDRSIDRLPGDLPSGAARRLVVVYDAGKMPHAADRFFATHPVQLGGVAVEGDAGSPVADASTTLLVDFLRNPPSVGDYAVATLVGGRWVAERGRSQHSKCDCAVASCAGYKIPQTLTLTDADGDVTLVYDPNAFFPTWYGGRVVQKTSCPVTTPNNVCVVGPPSNGPVKVCYQVVCLGGQDPHFQVQRSWSWVYQQGTLTPIYFQADAGNIPTPGLPCITAPPAICGSPLTDTAGGSGNPTSADPFTLTVNLAANMPPNQTADPVGGGVTIKGPPIDSKPHFCVTFCLPACGDAPTAGATITVSDDSGVVASGTTGFGRCVQLDVGSAGTYTVTVDLPGKGGYKAVTYTQTLNIQGCQVGLLCCAATCFDFCGDVTGCPPSVRIVGEGHGAIYDGPLAVNRTPSGSLGCVSVPIQDPGDTYTAFLGDLPPGYAADPGGYPVHCGNNTYQPLLTVTPDSFGVRHCCGVPIPAVLTLTDAKGGCTLTYDPTTGNWTGCHTFEQANTYICGSNPNTCGTRQISIVYTCNCQADGGTGQRLFSVTRQWFQLVAIPVGCADPSYHESGCGGVCPDGGASGGPCICTSGALLPIAPCEAFSVAGPLVVDPINSCNSTSGFVNSVDPVGGGVAIS